MTSNHGTAAEFHVTTSAGYSFRTTDEQDALQAVTDQLAKYGYPKTDGFVTDLALALRNNALTVGSAPWFYGHVQIEAVEPAPAPCSYTGCSGHYLALGLDVPVWCDVHAGLGEALAR